MMEKVIQLLKDKTFTIPHLLFTKYKNLGLTDQEFIVLIALINSDSHIYNPSLISSEVGTELYELLNIVNNIVNKGLITIETKQVLKTREEYIVFDSLYQKLAFLFIDAKEEKEKTNIFDAFEKEFGRTLSSIEYELISAWVNGEFTEEIILLALKEAVYNGVSNLRYIDKILYEWKKKGIKNKEDVEKDREHFKKNKKETTELYDYDWLNEDDN